MNASRFKFPHAAIRLPSSDVFVAGGAEFPEVFRSKERIFVNVAEGFEAARYFVSATLLADGRVLVVGGYSQEANGLPATSRAWLYQPIRSIRGSAPFTYVALTTAEAHVNSVPQHWTQHNHDDHIILSCRTRFKTNCRAHDIGHRLRLGFSNAFCRFPATLSKVHFRVRDFMHQCGECFCSCLVWKQSNFALLSHSPRGRYLVRIAQFEAALPHELF
jgi:hypothetical protein